MRAVVTGAAGFIGSYVAEILIATGHEVLVIDDLSGGFEENIPVGCRFEQRSVLSSMGDLFDAFRPDVVYHLAAYAAEGLSHHIPIFNYQNNVVGTVNMLSAAYQAGASHFVFTSSIAAYGHPANNGAFEETSPCRPCDPYGTAKLACEQHIRSFRAYYGRPDYTVFRPHNVFGPRQNISDPYRNVVGIFMRCSLLGEPMPVFGDGEQSRCFSYITPVARCIAEAPWTVAATNETFNVGGDESISVAELARQVAEVMGVPLEIRWLPARNEVVHAHCRHERMRAVFPVAWQEMVGIREGLRKMAAEIRHRPIPAATECPAAIEISDRLPPSWQERLAGGTLSATR